MDAINPAYLHLLINHIPVILAPLGFFVAILAAITRRRAVWLYALATLTLAGISAWPVMATGDAAGDFVRHNVPGVSREAIDSHEESGDTVMWVLLVGGAVAAYGWWRMGRRDAERLPIWLVALVLLTSAASAVGVTITSVKGGEIIHKEAHMKPGSKLPGATPAPAERAGRD